MATDNNILVDQLTYVLIREPWATVHLLPSVENTNVVL